MSDAAITISITSNGLGYLFAGFFVLSVALCAAYIVKRNTQP